MLFDGERRAIMSDLRQLKIDAKIIKFSDITYVGIGGEPYSFVFPRTLQDLEKIVGYVTSHDIPFWVIGNGTKLLVRDGKIPRLVISLSRFDLQEEKDNGDSFTLRLGAGVSLQFVVACGIKKGFKGVEALAGIPGCIGGAVKMNAGTRIGSISDFIQSVQVLTISNGRTKLEEIKPEFKYRWSSIKDNQIVLSATLTFKKEKPVKVRDEVSKYLKKRFETQPVSAKTFGCIFKNPENGESAGKIIDELGLKGFRLTKRARVSPIHANFIENEGDACFAEVDELIKYVKDKVKQERKIELEEEVVRLLDDS